MTPTRERLEEVRAILPLRHRRSASARGAGRDPHWDNVRWVAGTLVLFGHAMDQLRDIEGLRWLYVATWAMRVPVFVMVAGYFSNAGPVTPREARRLIESILVPYLAISLLHTLQIHHYSDTGEWRFFTINPAWGLWFLLSLLFWRAGLPFLAQLRYPLATSVAVALIAGYVVRLDVTFSVSRTLTFLPFFLLGWKMRQGLFSGVLRARWSLPTAWAVISTTCAAAWFLKDHVDLHALGMRDPYGAGHLLNAPLAWLPRGAMLLLGMIIAVSLLRVVPKRRVPVITYLGAGGLYVYLLHPLVLRYYLHTYGTGWVGPWQDQLALVLLCVALAAALASPPVRWAARPLVQPRLPWLFRPAEPAAPRAHPPHPGGAGAGGESRTAEPSAADTTRIPMPTSR